MPDQATFEAALDDLLQARDWPRAAAMRLVYADWLEERGDPLAGAQRWLAALGKAPRPTGRSWDWWRYGDRPGSNPEDLPGAIWSRLPGAPLRDVPDCKEYPTRPLAEKALGRALLLLDLLPS